MYSSNVPEARRGALSASEERPVESSHENVLLGGQLKRREIMNVTCVTVFVKEEHIDDFIEATIPNHEGALEEPGNVRFDVLQSVDDPSRFMLYEVYETDEAAAAHKQTKHYLRWRETVSGWMAKPRQGSTHRVIRPTERGRW